MFVKPSSAFVGLPSVVCELLGQREVGAIGEVVAVDEEEVAVARGRVVELQLGSGERLRAQGNGIVTGPCRSSRSSAFSEDYLDEAGDAARRAPPAAPGRRAAAARRVRASRAGEEAIVQALGFSDADGVAATRGGRLVGYLLGMRKGDDWGPNVWVEAAGHAAEDAEDVRDLYAAAAAGWVADGRTAHYAVVPATDADALDAWFRLGFAQQHAYGIMERRRRRVARGHRRLAGARTSTT